MFKISWVWTSLYKYKLHSLINIQRLAKSHIKCDFICHKKTLHSTNSTISSCSICNRTSIKGKQNCFICIYKPYVTAPKMTADGLCSFSLKSAIRAVLSENSIRLTFQVITNPNHCRSAPLLKIHAFTLTIPSINRLNSYGNIAHS